MPDFAMTPHFGMTFAGALVLLALLTIASRVPVIGTLVRLAITAALLALMAGLLLERGSFDPWLGRWATLLHPDEQQVSGGEMRIRVARDGHYWARVEIGGLKRRMLVDSGATLTALSAATAKAAGIEPIRSRVPVSIQTANGEVPGRIAKVPMLRFGDIEARNLTAVVSPSFGDLDVLGMNFLARLKRWRVEDGELVLTPNPPQTARKG